MCELTMRSIHRHHYCIKLSVTEFWKSMVFLSVLRFGSSTTAARYSGNIKKRCGYKWTRETIQHYSWTQVKVKGHFLFIAVLHFSQSSIFKNDWLINWCLTGFKRGRGSKMSIIWMIFFYLQRNKSTYLSEWLLFYVKWVIFQLQSTYKKYL